MDALLADASAKVAQRQPAWSDDDYLDFSRTGNRSRGERMLAQRRSFLYPFVIAACVTGDLAMLAKVEEVLLATLRDPSWTFPAHDKKLGNFRGTEYDVDLLSADIAHDIAQTLYMLKSQLPASTVAIAMETLEKRIFKPMRATFRSGKGHFLLNAQHNWNAVCLKGVTGAALAVLGDKKDRAQFVAIAEHYIANYLESFTDDGYALEGPAYWNYGFSHFSELRHILGQATQQKVDLFAKHPKAREIALYGYRFPMHNGNMAQFGDAAVTRADPFTLTFGNEAFGFGQSEVQKALPITLRPWINSAPISTAAITLTEPILRLPGDKNEGRIDPLRSLFATAGILVSRASANTPTSLSVSIKAGGNQNHSHNDIGSYTIGVADAQPVGDPGKAPYSAKSFGPQRYEIRANNSYGHPVPRIDNTLQRLATTFTTAAPQVKTSPERDVFVLDMRAAYALPGVQKLQRTMSFDRINNSVQVLDEFEFEQAKPFEGAITSIGKAERLDSSRYRFTHKGKSVIATISASSAFEATLEQIDEEGLSFERLAVRPKEPQQRGFVRIDYTSSP
jgi:Heparinase II/III-like protein